MSFELNLQSNIGITCITSKSPTKNFITMACVSMDASVITCILGLQKISILTEKAIEHLLNLMCIYQLLWNKPFN